MQHEELEKRKEIIRERISIAVYQLRTAAIGLSQVYDVDLIDLLNCTRAEATLVLNTRDLVSSYADVLQSTLNQES